jgi:hypothetical protein
MPEKETLERARRDKRQGKSPSTQAGEFVREEMEHIREGKHGARSPEQAIAIGLSKARRSGVKLPAPEGEKSSTKRKARQDLRRGASKKKTSTRRARATRKALKSEGRSAASKKALSAHARKAARERTASDRSASAKKAARTKGPAKRSAAAKKAARTRARRK